MTLLPVAEIGAGTATVMESPRASRAKPEAYSLLSSASVHEALARAIFIGSVNLVRDPYTATNDGRGGRMRRLLSAWAGDDPDEQRATLIQLKRSLDDQRTSSRPLFPES